jgi:hypothetical protein
MGTDSENSKDLYPRVYASRTRPDAVTAAIVKAQVLVGVALAAIAGPVFAHAMTAKSVMLWVIGGICLMTGVVLAVAGLTSSKRRMQALLRPESRAPQSGEERDPSMPMLGALLVYKYKVISEAQLERALELQRREKRKGRNVLLGELLLEMGLAKEGQLRAALDYQRSRSRKGPADS